MSNTHESTPEQMRAVVGRRYGTADVLVIESVPVPTATQDQVLVAVKASSLNALDWHFVTGTPYLIRLMNGLRTPKRLVPGADVAGTVVAIGPDVAHLKVGDDVFGECSGGGCSPYLTVREGAVVIKPPTVSFADAGATGVAGLTAVQALRTHGKVQPGDHVVINGAAGGVGTFAVQIAKAMGATVTAVCSGRNVDLVRSLGADTVIDYTTADFVDGGSRFDVMVDNVGNRSSSECVSVMRPGGRYVAVSGPKANKWLGPIPHIARLALAFRRANATFHQFTASPNEADLVFLGELLEQGKLVPAMDRTIGLDGVADAVAEIGRGHTRAKIGVIPT